MEFIYIFLASIFALIGWVGNKLVITLEKIQGDISDIRITIQDVSTSHNDLQERVDKIETKVFNLNGQK